MRSFAAAASIGARALRIASISLGRKSFPVRVLRQFAAGHLLKIDLGYRHLRPTQLPTGNQTPLASDQQTIGADHDGVQQTNRFDAARQPVDVPHVPAVARADFHGIKREREAPAGAHAATPATRAASTIGRMVSTGRSTSTAGVAASRERQLSGVAHGVSSPAGGRKPIAVNARVAAARQRSP